MIDNRLAFGVVGGLGALAGADFLQHLIRTTSVEPDRFAVAFEQQSFRGDRVPAGLDYDPTGRKLHVFSLLQRLERRGVDMMCIPCFISHTFIEEMIPNIGTPIISLMDALVARLSNSFSAVRRVGVLTSDYVRYKRLFDHALADEYEAVYPEASMQQRLMEAVYGPRGIKTGGASPDVLDEMTKICLGLVQSNCDIILPGFTELSLVHDQLAPRLPVQMVNINHCYAEYARAYRVPRPLKPFKLGVVGGVGPLATVDFMRKVVTLTKASRDQDHIKIIVEQNPQIPDRTEHLVHQGTDPTVAMFATCKKLEAAEADLIAIPCNTAHAFVDRLQSHLRVPVLNMLDETMTQAANLYPGEVVGLLATSGTVESGVYAMAAQRADVEMIVPDAVHQERVMQAIYGESGVKAGYTQGTCQVELLAAIDHLASRGATVIIMGCTELPLIALDVKSLEQRNEPIKLLDPTKLLAAACVRHSQLHRRNF